MPPRITDYRQSSLPRAFTLIEVLVAIAIVILLAAIVLPALSAARVRAKVNVCLSNVRQLGMAVHLYAADANDKFAYGIPAIWSDARDSVPTDLEARALTAPIVEPLLAPYGAVPSVLKSPDDRPHGADSLLVGKSYFDAYGTSYHLRRRPFLVPHFLTDYAAPAYEPLAHDIEPFHRPQATYADGRICTVFMDGHVAHLTWRDVMSRYRPDD